LGSDAFLHGILPELPEEARSEDRRVIARVDPAHPPVKGQRVYLRIQPGKEHLFSVATGNRLPG
jgi:multiple sugar transport system ATP-binding protein